MLELTESPLDSARSAWHSQDSSLREQALGHLFLGQLLAEMWRSNQRDIEVLKGEVDRGGLRPRVGVERLYQARSAQIELLGSKVRNVSVGTKLLAKPGGCVIWLEFDAESLKIERYFGSAGPRAGAPRSRIKDLPPLEGQQHWREGRASHAPRIVEIEVRGNIEMGPLVIRLFGSRQR